MRRLSALLDSQSAPRLAATASLLLGLIFVFVWAPHPWGWHGIDQYHELARGLARGEPFATTDVPWGYAYFVALFYWLFGDRAWVPVTAQVVANATVPVMLYTLVRRFVSHRIAGLASLLVGVLSFNTIYASTLSSDSMCTVLFIASLLCLVRGHERDSRVYFAISGLLSGTVPQFRPNMILFPIVVALLYVVLFWRTRPRTLTQMSTYLVLMAIALSPWVIRNYRLTGAILPTSTHGGVQLWYGTLQTGPYLESRAYNPRSIFEASAFDYTSMAGQPIIVTAQRQRCDVTDEGIVDLVYWTDRDARRVTLNPRAHEGDRLEFELPGQSLGTTLYYFFRLRWQDPATGASREQLTPFDAVAAPLVFFVSDEHLHDLDRHGDLLDAFDVVRLMRHLAWQEPLGLTPTDIDRDGRTSQGDLVTAVVRLLGDRATDEAIQGFESTDTAATLRLSDGSTLSVERDARPRITDVEVRGTLAGSLMSARRRLHARADEIPRGIEACRVVWQIAVNDVFYRKEPHQMRRYMALAADNIARDPMGFVTAAVYRMGRLFVIRGTDDRQTTQQFEGSALVYKAALVLSLVYVALFMAGVVIGWRRYAALRLLLVPIAYVPLTIAPVLTNMRYTVTVQPLMFVFIAVTIVTLFRLAERSQVSDIS